MVIYKPFRPAEGYVISNMYCDEELEQLMNDADKRAREGRLERLRVLFEYEVKEPAPIPGLAYEYFEEARLCWYIGAFVATIVLSQMAFEETLRSYYRVTKGVKGKLDAKTKVDRVGFARLIDEATQDRLLTGEEAENLHSLRKEYRNPYVHAKDVNEKSGKDFLSLNWKIASLRVKEEAENAVLLLITLLPKLSRRFFGLGNG